MLKTTKRFDEAVKKLYNAFHENRLNAMDPCACAVGNLCDNSSGWCLNYATNEAKNTGYSVKELTNVENIFMYGKQWTPYDINSKNKELVFEALCAVIEYLCQLDNIPNIMDYKKLFETEENKLKYELNTIITC